MVVIRKKHIVALSFVLFGVLLLLCGRVVFRIGFGNAEEFQGASGDVSRGIENYKVDQMKCSKDCCSIQWPVPFYTHGLKTKDIYTANSFRCSNGVESGCPCMKKNQFNFISNRGGNAGGNLKDMEKDFREDVLIRPKEDVNPIASSKMTHEYASYDSHIVALPTNGMIVGVNNI